MIDFVALVTYYTAANGGRKTPIGPEYNPVLEFKKEGVRVAADQAFKDKVEVFPGESIETNFTVLHKDDLYETLYEGQNFELTENRNAIASGVVLKVNNKKMVAL